MFKFSSLRSLFLFLALSPLATAVADGPVPRTINYQGYLTDSTGSPVDAPVNLALALYRTPSGGSPLWSSARLVPVEAGLFSVLLGSEVALPAGLSDGPLYLGVAVDGDAEMTPRRSLSSQGFALRAESADALQGASLDDVLAFAADGAIPAGARLSIADVNITEVDVDPGSIALALDGRSIDLQYTTMAQVQWAPVVVEYTYPLGDPPPLGVAQGRLTFDLFEMLLTDGSGFSVVLRGNLVSVSDARLTTMDDGAGGFLVHTRLALEGLFSFPSLEAPAAAGPLSVTLSGAGSDSFFASTAGPWRATLPGHSGGGGAAFPTYLVEVQGLGAAEFKLLNDNYVFTSPFVIALDLQGDTLPGASDCRLSRISGLSPATAQAMGVPVATVTFESAQFECDAPLNP